MSTENLLEVVETRLICARNNPTESAFLTEVREKLIALNHLEAEKQSLEQEN